MSTNEGELRMRQIEASEVKPGMTIRFDMDGWRVEGTVSRVEPVFFGLEFYSTQGVEMTLREDSPVTVLAEPAQPEEPKAFGARARVHDGRFIRLDDEWSSSAWYEMGTARHWSWAALCEMGPVQVVPDLGWTVPDDAPEVPEVPEVPDRIEEWPKDDTALRPYPWRDHDGDTWKWIASASEWECYNAVDNYVDSGRRPFYGPWTRVPHA